MYQTSANRYLKACVGDLLCKHISIAENKGSHLFIRLSLDVRRGLNYQSMSLSFPFCVTFLSSDDYKIISNGWILYSKGVYSKV